MKLLEITASNREEGSVSRSLSTDFLTAWREKNPAAEVAQRDVGLSPPGHFTQEKLASNFTPPAARTPEQVEVIAESDALIDEFMSAERIVIATPMYNFSVPSMLKAYIDNLIRKDLTFAFDEEKFEFTGLATGKRALVITSCGGDYSEGTPAAAMDFLGPYLKSVLGFIGITDVTVVNGWNQMAPPEMRTASTDAARKELVGLAESW